MKKNLTVLFILICILLTAAGCGEAGDAAESAAPFTFEGRWACTYVQSMGLRLKSSDVDMEYTLDVYGDGVAILDMGTTETKCSWTETEEGYTIHCFDTDFSIEVDGQKIVWNFNNYYMTFVKEEGTGAGDHTAFEDDGQAAEEFTGTGDLKGPLYDTAEAETPEAGSVPASLEQYEALADLGVEKYYLTYGEVCALLNCHGFYNKDASEEGSAVYRWPDETGSAGISITFRDNGEGQYLLYLITHDMETEED